MLRGARWWVVRERDVWGREENRGGEKRRRLPREWEWGGGFGSGRIGGGG